jgi:beta-1,2-mannobiose phosphorylase / 1,2-beta-oligomannan phosphorylase
MISVSRYQKNPILSPDKKHAWEAEAAFNGCPIVDGNLCHMVYRATSTPIKIENKTLELSSIGHTLTSDRVTFGKRHQLIHPEHPWEMFGCEDPRVTKIDNTYYIFYTAISHWPPIPEGISVAVATTSDFLSIQEKHHVTPFNAKAMTLFPEKINGKFAVLLTVNPDIPPSTIAIAYLDTLSDLWNKDFWLKWHEQFKNYAVNLLRTTHDHVEIGAPPIKTKYGWLLIYSYIKSYLTSHKFFGIEAVLLDLDNPQKIIKRTDQPLLYPEHDYELIGKIPNVIFPSGAIIYNDVVGIYYGAADTSVALATCSLNELLTNMVIE